MRQEETEEGRLSIKLCVYHYAVGQFYSSQVGLQWDSTSSGLENHTELRSSNPVCEQNSHS